MRTYSPPPQPMEDAGKLVLRVTIGLLILLHGVSKISHGVDGIAGMLQKSGLPGALAYAVYVGEVLAPLLLIAGVWTRLAASIVVINMLVAIGMSHAGQILKLGEQGGWAIELQGLYLLGAVAVALLGAGRYSVGRTNSLLN